MNVPVEQNPVISTPSDMVKRPMKDTELPPLKDPPLRTLVDVENETTPLPTNRRAPAHDMMFEIVSGAVMIVVRLIDGPAKPQGANAKKI
jgi:hypothetical protein